MQYEGFNVEFFKAFLSVRKSKANGKTCSHRHLSKFVDAVKWGAKQAKAKLPLVFYEKTEAFLESFKKETAVAKMEGNLDKNEADPIPFALLS